jgi:hypothetical protein
MHWQFNLATLTIRHSVIFSRLKANLDIGIMVLLNASILKKSAELLAMRCQETVCRPDLPMQSDRRVLRQNMKGCGLRLGELTHAEKLGELDAGEVLRPLG